VAHDVRAIEAQFVEQFGDGNSKITWSAAAALRLARRVTVTREIDGDHIMVIGKRVDDGIP
jgi:hypothetical protein